MVNSHTIIYNDFISRIVYLWESEVPSLWIQSVCQNLPINLNGFATSVLHLRFPKATDQKHNLCVGIINCYLFQCDLQATVKSFLTKIIYLTYLLQCLKFYHYRDLWLMNLNTIKCKFMVPRTSVKTWSYF